MLNYQTRNAPSVQETRELLTALVNAQYPEIKSLKVKKDGKLFSIRAKFKRRRINASARHLHRVVIKFFDAMNQKVYLQPYIEA